VLKVVEKMVHVNPIQVPHLTHNFLSVLLIIDGHILQEATKDRACTTTSHPNQYRWVMPTSKGAIIQV
jgi:hypothetical protein